MGVSALLVLAGAISVQSGAGIAARLFSQLPPAAVTTLRLWSAALIMLAVGGRGAARAVARLISARACRDAVAAGAFGIFLAVMNFAIYQAFHAIPLGIAVTVEFLGPLAVAVAGTRRLVSLAWVALATAGVLLLARVSGGVWMSTQPAVAALIGLALLGQRLSGPEWAGICCVAAASAGAARGAAPSPVQALRWGACLPGLRA